MKLLKIALTAGTVLGFSFTLRAADETPSQLPKKLPAKLAKKKPKKTKVNFEVNSGTHVTTVVVRTPLPLEQALDDQARARHEVQDLRERGGTKGNDKAAVIPPYGTPLALSSAQEIQQPMEKPSPRPDYHLINQQEAANRKSILLEDARTAPTPLPAAPAVADEPAPVKVQVETAAIVKAPTPAPVPAAPAPTVAAKPAATSTALAPVTTQEDRSRDDRFLARVSYLDAHYNELEGDLQNGANSLGLGIARRFGDGEGRLQLEVGFGMDQDVAAQNVRYLIARSDYVYFFSSGTLQPFIGAGVGFANFNVRSQRANPRGGADLIYRQHASGSAFIASPSAGARFDFRGFALDLSAEYLVVAGAGSSSALGGWVSALTLALPF